MPCEHGSAPEVSTRAAPKTGRPDSHRAVQGAPAKHALHRSSRGPLIDGHKRDARHAGESILRSFYSWIARARQIAPCERNRVDVGVLLGEVRMHACSQVVRQLCPVSLIGLREHHMGDSGPASSNNLFFDAADGQNAAR
mmetsp:Transcript_6764/g.20506  ORF Transcript_6764/g.20506 Transcript_6764/m.20506 type:complete len:140 (+) Transcript_6764:487-906(+)